MLFAGITMLLAQARFVAPAMHVIGHAAGRVCIVRHACESRCEQKQRAHNSIDAAVAT
jgi:hypothetical protein